MCQKCNIFNLFSQEWGGTMLMFLVKVLWRRRQLLRQIFLMWCREVRLYQPTCSFHLVRIVVIHQRSNCVFTEHSSVQRLTSTWLGNSAKYHRVIFDNFVANTWQDTLPNARWMFGSIINVSLYTSRIGTTFHEKLVTASVLFAYFMFSSA